MGKKKTPKPQIFDTQLTIPEQAIARGQLTVPEHAIAPGELTVPEHAIMYASSNEHGVEGAQTPLSNVLTPFEMQHFYLKKSSP